jgi:hypothetical protein
MKKDCFQILGIPRTNSRATIKKAFRDKIKKYHPDKVQAPEKMRKYTIKCAELIRAYKEAIEFAETYQGEPKITATPDLHKPGVFGRIFAALLFALIIYFPIALIIEALGIYPALSLVFYLYDSMPLESPLRMIISFPLAIILPVFINCWLSVFTSLPFTYIWAALESTKYEKYMYKISYVMITVLNISIVYYWATDLYWPFWHRANGYYNFLYHLCRFLSWAYFPIFMLNEWVMDYLKYRRVKKSSNLGELTLYEKGEL